MPREPHLAGLPVGALVNARHVATAVAMLSDDISDVSIRQVTVEVQPPKESCRSLKKTVNEFRDDPKVSLVVGEHCLPQTTSKGRARNLSVSETSISVILARGVDCVLQVVYR